MSTSRYFPLLRLVVALAAIAPLRSVTAVVSSGRLDVVQFLFRPECVLLLPDFFEHSTPFSRKRNHTRAPTQCESARDALLS